MVKSVRHLVSSVSLVFTGFTVTAQEPNVLVSAEVSFFAPKVPERPIYFMPSPDRTPVEIQFFSTARSQTHSYFGSPIMDLLVKDSRTASGFLRIARADLRNTLSKSLIVIRKAEDADQQYEAVSVRDDATAFPSNSIIIDNRSGMELAIKLGDEAKILRTGKNPPMRLGGSSRMEVIAEVRGRLLTAYSRSLRIPEEGRVMLFLLPPKFRGSIELETRVLVDSVDDTNSE
jgi:hypothetical protein